jgi:vitamin B12 transporter
MHKYFLKTTFFLFLFFCLPCGVDRGFAEGERDMSTLKMFYDEDDIIVTPTRYPKSISQVAENVTVITADDIKALNAHTLADALVYVTGLQLFDQGSPGSYVNGMIQGSQPWHVLLMIDGVAMNNLSESTPDLGLVPVQIIERIEIIKGPASSSWGSSLGGVINVITRSPDDTREFGGMLSASIGERNTGDYRLEISGGKGAFGYYLSGGGMLTDGLLPYNGYHGGNFYTKLKYSCSEKAVLAFTLGYTRGVRQVGAFREQIPELGAELAGTIDSKNENIFTTLGLDYQVARGLALNLSLRALWQDTVLAQKTIIEPFGVEIDSKKEGSDAGFGGSAKLVWTQRLHEMVVGTDFDTARLKSPNIEGGKQRQDKWAVYVNDSLTLGKFSVTPGLRFDHTNTNGDFWSPSLGVTFAPAENTILRAYVARGFNTPFLSSTFGNGVNIITNPDLKMEKIWSYVVGLETTFFRYFWLKTSLFRHDISDVIDTVSLPDDTPDNPDDDNRMWVNVGKQRRQGLEVELKTMPLYNTALSLGYALLDSTDRLTGDGVPNMPHYTWDVGIHYDDRKSFRATLKGHFISWDVNPDIYVTHSSMTWDLYLAKKIYSSEYQSMELFFSARNIFKGAQYFRDIFRNTGRWVEGGIRFHF